MKVESNHSATNGARARLRRAVTLACATAVLIGCASLPLPDQATQAFTTVASIATNADTCRDMLSEASTKARSELDPTDIKLVNWNIQKSQNENSLADLDTLAANSHLVLIQEAALASDLAQRFEDAAHWSFAPGYETGETLTGVMTLSSALPLSRCHLSSIEPWLRSPKATNITEYALAGTDETLAVVNIHAVNFTFGTQKFRQQFEQIAVVLEAHDGPIILSGDFNTWRQQRFNIVNEIGEKLGLKPVNFDNDQRTQRFGYTIDHVYIRGLTEVAAETHAVSTSDHNAMSVRLSTPASSGGNTYAW